MAITLERRSTPEHLNLVGGEPEIFHCHHYNTVLQQSIEDAGAAMDTTELLRDGAAIVAHAQLSTASKAASPADRRALASEHFRLSGFGLADLAGLSATGGKATVANSHYALGFQSRKMARKAPVCSFAAGYMEGYASAAFEKPLGSYKVRETQCAAVSGGKTCTFELEVLPRPRALKPSVGAGSVPRPFPARQAIATSVDEPKILGALATIPFLGNEEGLIPAFGLYLTRHYANYYNYISYEFERRLVESHKHLANAAREVLTEAGHVCAFNTFGGIMESPEWAGLIEPMCQKRTDWVSGIVACVNAFGWGRWTVQDVSEERLVVRVDGSYESNYFLAAYGKGTQGHCYLAAGGTAGIMNLLYVGDITTKPVLDLAFYEKLFSGPRSFRATETKCRSKGDAWCEFVAERKTYR